jgi:hypothetical protein
MELGYSIPEYVHPAGAVTIQHWITDALDALDGFNPAEAERLKKAIADKIALERIWHEENRAD